MATRAFIRKGTGRGGSVTMVMMLTHDLELGDECLVDFAAEQLPDGRIVLTPRATRQADEFKGFDADQVFTSM